MENDKDNIYEEKLLRSFSNTHSVVAFLQQFSIDLAIYGTFYLTGYYKLNPAWLLPPLVLLIIKDYWVSERERRKLKEIRNILRDDEKQLVLSDLNQLPPWVHFPDVERCSSLNELLAHVWPHVSTIVTNTLRTGIELGLCKKIPFFKIQTISLGSVPPCISGIKIYDRNLSNRQLILDATLCYSGDSEFSASFSSLKVGVQNFQLDGTVRISFNIHPSPPFVGGLEFSFLGNPKIDFVLTGLVNVGILEEAIRKIIDDTISSTLVFPKRKSGVWGKELQEDLMTPGGVIRINVLEARNLESKDGFLNNRESDPFAEVNYGSKTFVSGIVENSSSPTWNLWCEFVTEKNNSEPIVIKIWDKDQNTPDDLIGSCSIDTKYIKKKGKLDSWFQLENSKGSVHTRAFFLEITPDIEAVKYPPLELSFLSSYVFVVHIKSAQNLVVPGNSRRPSALVQLTVGNDTQTTKTVFNNDEPVFEETFYFLVINPEFNKFRAKLVDQKTKKGLGSFSFSLRKLLDRHNLEIIDQYFPLIETASDSSFALSMRLRVINNSGF